MYYKDITIYFKDNSVKLLKDIYEWHIYKNISIKIILENDDVYKYLIADLDRIVVTTKSESKSICQITNDTIIF